MVKLGDVELIERMLRPKIAGQALDEDVAHLVKDADLYSDTPDELVAGRPRNSWYFFSQVRYRSGRKLLRRHHHGGLWRPCPPRREVVGDSGPVGYCSFFMNYLVDKVKTDWVMIEYSIPQDQEEEQWVLCEVRKNRQSMKPLPLEIPTQVVV